MRLAIELPPQSPVPATFLDSAATLTGALAELAARFPDYGAMRFLDRRHREEVVTLTGLWQRARALQALFVARGLRPEDTVVLALPTGAELVAAYFAAVLAGARPGLVATPFHRYAADAVYAAHLAPILALARPRVLYATPAVARLARTVESIAGGAAVVLSPDEFCAAPEAPIFAAHADDIAMVQYSSGSTGAPKGVLLSHRCLLANMRATRRALALSARDVSVNWIPLYHDMGLIDGLLQPLLGGSQVVLIPTAEFLREPELWLWAIHHCRGTVSSAPNFAYALCARRIPDEALQGLDLSSWHSAINAAEPVLARTLEDFAGRFARHGLRREALRPAWGLAEAVCMATVHPRGEAPRIECVDRRGLATERVARRAGAGEVSVVSVGACLPGGALEVRDEMGRVLPDRHVGTLWVRSPSLFRGYLRDTPPVAEALLDGWLNSGDEGYAAEGRFYFVARRKDLIVVGGEKIAPQDVESAIDRVAGVRTGCCVAFGVSNVERGTEDVAAVVETRIVEAAEREALRVAIREEVARRTGLGLRHVVLVAPGGVEKTTSGKLARGATRRRYIDAIPPLG